MPEGLSKAPSYLNASAMKTALDKIVEDVAQALRDGLRLRGQSLAVLTRKAGRRLPSAVRRDASYLVECQAVAQNPKLARRINLARAKAARHRILLHLESVNIGAERVTMVFSIVASVAFVLIVTGIGVLFVLVQRGYV